LDGGGFFLLVQKKWMEKPKIIAPIWKISISIKLTEIWKPRMTTSEFITVQG
jgi:hypothetical protein